jgi:hypothetical protein
MVVEDLNYRADCVGLVLLRQDNMDKKKTN